MKQENIKMTNHEKIKLIIMISLFGGFGAILGVIAYYESWLG